MRDKSKGGTAQSESARGGSTRPLDDADADATGTAMHAAELEIDEEEDGSDIASKPVSTDMQQFIGRQLRAVFDDVAKQPVPDRFLELMKQLEQKTGS